MPQAIKRSLVPELISRFSALYQIGIVNEKQKNELARLTRTGIQDGYESLYEYLRSLNIQHELIDEIKDILLF